MAIVTYDFGHVKINTRKGFYMDYKRIYDELVESVRYRVPLGGYEMHHVVPKCMGGSDHYTNIVFLSFKEHVVAHLLLYKIHGKQHPDLIFAIDAMYRWDRYVHRDIRDMAKWIRRKLTIRRSQLKIEQIKKH